MCIHLIVFICMPSPLVRCVCVCGVCGVCVCVCVHVCVVCGCVFAYVYSVHVLCICTDCIHMYALTSCQVLDDPSHFTLCMVYDNGCKENCDKTSL